MSRDQGFTLIEMIAVLAVVSALMAILSPRVFLYVEDAKEIQARGDVRQIAAAIHTMYKDTRRWPFYKNGQGKLAYSSGTDAGILTSNPLCRGEALATCDASVPEDATSGNTWGLASAISDSLTNQLVRNRPFDMAAGSAAYRLAGSNAWKGPYLDHMPDTDPWGHSYLVNIANADPATQGPAQSWVVVISAGPNGKLETPATALATTGLTSLGDDIVARVR